MAERTQVFQPVAARRFLDHGVPRNAPGSASAAARFWPVDGSKPLSSLTPLCLPENPRHSDLDQITINRFWV